MELTVKVDHKKGIKFENQATISDQLHQMRLLKTARYSFTHIMQMFKGNDRTRNVEKESLSWDILLHDNPDKLEEHKVFQKLNDSCIPINNFKVAEKVYKRKKAKYDIFSTTLQEFKETERFKKARQAVLDSHGHELNDGTFLYDYQVDCAALIVGRRRLLNAMDMGLGSAKRSV